MKNRKYRKNAEFVLVSLFKVMSRFSFFSFGRKGHFILKGFVGGGCYFAKFECGHKNIKKSFNSVNVNPRSISSLGRVFKIKK